MDARTLKGLEIAARMRISCGDDGAWSVPSQSGNGAYRVVLWPGAEKCTCPDFELRLQPCKHIVAAKLAEERDGGKKAPAVDTDNPPKRKTYKQNWPAYNEAQTHEKDRFQILLNDLCSGIIEPDRAGRPGRKPHPVKDAVFAATFKVYCMFSSRRFSCDLRDAYGKGYTASPIPGAKVPQFLENPELTPILTRLIAESARPLAVVDTAFAVDSSGFGSSRFEPWYDQKYGVPRRECVWVKVHVSVGVKTNVVTAVRILDKDAADSPQFRPLVEETARTFTIGEVSADKAYCGLDNFEAVAQAGGTGFIPFKSNATGAAGGLYEKMFHYFLFRREEFLQHYHMRSNIESTFSAVKRLFGDAVRSRTDVAMVNEVLCKLLAFNITVLIHEQCELGIEAVFWKDGPGDGQAVTRAG